MATGITYTPNYIKQSLSNKAKDLVTAERWNELWNLNIEQGDKNSEILKAIVDYLNNTVDPGLSAGFVVSGEWDEEATYPINSLVYTGVGVYLSLINSNTGNDPTISPEAWSTMFYYTLEETSSESIDILITDFSDLAE